MKVFVAILNKKFILAIGVAFWFSLSFGQNRHVSASSSVIVLRAEGDAPGSKPAWIYVDGKRECGLTAGRHLLLSRDSGEHAFFVSFSAKRKLTAREQEAAISVKCEAGKTMYLHVVSNPANRKSISCTPIVESSARKLLQASKVADCQAKK